MAVVLPKVKLTWNEYRLFPNDGKRHELIDGDHYMSPSPKALHQGALSNLFLLLGSVISRLKLGRLYTAPFDVIFSEFDVVEPDLLFVSAARVNQIVQDWVRGAPDLVIEIVSPGTQEIDRTLKFKLYEKYGVREYWLVDPENKTIEVYGLGEGGYELYVEAHGNRRVKSQVLTGINFAARRVFE